jgi:microcystin-dependent protein
MYSNGYSTNTVRTFIGGTKLIGDSLSVPGLNVVSGVLSVNEIIAGTAELITVSAQNAIFQNLCVQNFSFNVSSLSLESVYAVSASFDNLLISNLSLENLSIANFTLSRGYTQRSVQNTLTVANLQVRKERVNDLNAERLSCMSMFADSFNMIPAGVILPYASSNSPSGYLLCDGSAYNTLDYPNLFRNIGFTYGSMSFGAFFLVPDCRDRALLGQGLGLSVGEYLSQNIPQHAHGISLSNGYALYEANESFDNVVGGGVKNVLTNIQNGTSGSLNQSLPVFINGSTLSTGLSIDGTRVRVRSLVINYIIKY